MSAVEIETCTRETVLEGASPIAHFFGRAPTAESWDRWLANIDPARVHAARADGRVVGGAGAFSFQLTVPGGRVPAAGVTAVGVLPTHRRRGILTALMREQLDDVRLRGEPVAYLWASESAIYGRYGYGMAAQCGDIELPRIRGVFAVPLERRTQARLVDTDEALDLLPPVYERVAAETPGMFARDRTWWERRVLADPEDRREAGSELQRVVLESDGRAEAYALYRTLPSWEHFASTGVLAVVEAVATTPSATRELWRYLFDVDWLDRLRARLLPVDHPLWFLLAEPRRMRFTVVESLWMRLVDVDAALRARSFREGEPVVFEVADEFCSWNAGRYRIGADGTDRVRHEPDLVVDVTALGSVYLGGFTFRQLWRAGRVEERVPGAVARADELFRTDGTAPWCPEVF